MTEPFHLSKDDVPISKVTIYRDRAEIQREWNQQLDSGTHQFLLHGLSGRIDEESIRVSLTGGPSQINQIFTSKTESGAKEETENFKKNDKLLKNKEIETVADIARLKKQRDVWQHYVEIFLKSNANNLTILPPVDESTAKNLTNFLNCYNEELKKIEENLLEKEKILQKTKDKLSANQSWWEECGKQTTVEMEVHVQENRTYTLTIFYTTEKAFWTPSYDIFVTGDVHRRMKILYKATIQQTTGEDWNDVQLSLASVPSNLPIQKSFDSNSPPPKPPRLQSQVQIKQDATLKRSESQMSNKSENQPFLGNSKFYGAANSKEEFPGRVDMLPEVQCDDVFLESRLGNVQVSVVPVLFEIPQSLSIPCDNSEILIECASTSIEVLLTHTCIPNLSHHVNITLTGINSGEHVAAGPTNVFLDQKFMGMMEIPTIGRMDPFELQLGQDPEVRALMKSPQKVRDERHLEILKHAFEVANNHDYPIHLSAIWDTKRNNGNAVSVHFVDAPITQAHVPGGSQVLQKGTLNSRGEVEWWIEIPARKSHWATLNLQVEWPIVTGTAGQKLPEVSYYDAAPAVYDTPSLPRKIDEADKKVQKQKSIIKIWKKNQKIDVI